MSKKSKKRQTRKGRVNTKAQQQASETRSKGEMTASNFNPDYSQTKKDLRRIGVLAGSFFIVLVVLSFFLS
jgi:hypothetical protein